MELIDKSTVVALIENLLDKSIYLDEYDCAYRDGNNCALYALKDKLNTLEVKEVDEEYNGKAMLHVLTKGVEQGKREILDKACEWLKKNRKNYSSNALGEEYLIDDFKKAMKEE